MENNGKTETAKYWKNGSPVILSGASMQTRTTSIAVSGSDVYLLGWVSIGHNIVGTYWKNGTEVHLGDGSQPLAAHSIFLLVQ